jgi:hypothetical protein
VQRPLFAVSVHFAGQSTKGSNLDFGDRKIVIKNAFAVNFFMPSIQAFRHLGSTSLDEEAKPVIRCEKLPNS